MSGTQNKSGNEPTRNENSSEPINGPLSTIKINNAPKFEDYGTIKSAVMETKRGRWFLEEFTRRNKVVDSDIVLKALSAIEQKIDASKTINKQTTYEPALQEVVADFSEFKTTKQNTIFTKLLHTYKSNSVKMLNWAGVTKPIEASKVKTIVEFASRQIIQNNDTQKTNIQNIIDDILSSKNDDNKLIKQLKHISSQLSTSSDTQSKLDRFLSFNLATISQLEGLQIDDSFDPENIEVETEISIEKTTKIEKNTVKNAIIDYENQLNTAKTAQIELQNELKSLKIELETHKNELKTLKTDQKQAKTQPKEAEVAEVEVTKPHKSDVKLGPAGRIKRMFKIETTLFEQQQENLEDLSEEAQIHNQAFDDAFQNEQLASPSAKNQVVTPENIESDIQPHIVNAQNSPKQTILDKQKQKLADVIDVMKQAGGEKIAAEPTIKAQQATTTDKQFNALNALALLSKTERTMLFTLQN